MVPVHQTSNHQVYVHHLRYAISNLLCHFNRNHSTRRYVFNSDVWNVRCPSCTSSSRSPSLTLAPYQSLLSLFVLLFYHYLLVPFNTSVLPFSFTHNVLILTHTNPLSETSLSSVSAYLQTSTIYNNERRSEDRPSAKQYGNSRYSWCRKLSPPQFWIYLQESIKQASSMNNSTRRTREDQGRENNSGSAERS